MGKGVGALGGYRNVCQRQRKGGKDADGEMPSNETGFTVI